MAGLGDRAVGLLLLLLGVAVFLYYTAWVFGAPFLPARSPLLAAFPPRELALLVPAALLAAVLTFAGAHDRSTHRAAERDLRHGEPGRP